MIINQYQDFSQEVLSENIFRTRNLYLAAYLLTTGFELVDQYLEDEGRHFTFCFNDKTSCDQQEKLFALGKVSVNVLKYVESIRFFKKIVSA